MKDCLELRSHWQHSSKHIWNCWQQLYQILNYDWYINKCPKILIVNTSYRNRKLNQEITWNWVVLSVVVKRKLGQEQHLRGPSVLLSLSTLGPETQVQWSFSGRLINSIEKLSTMLSITHPQNNNTHFQKQLDSRNLGQAIAKNNFMILSNKYIYFRV
jgi:hypothetical protein